MMRKAKEKYRQRNGKKNLQKNRGFGMGRKEMVKDERKKGKRR